MSTVHEILWKLSLEGDHSKTPRLVKAYTNSDAECDVVTVNLSTNCSNEQRQDIASSALSSPLETVIWGLLKTPAQYEAPELKDSLTEVICSRTNRDLEEDVISDMPGDFRRLMGGSLIDYELIDQDAWNLHDAGVKRKGTDGSPWLSIMTEKSVRHLQKALGKYKGNSPYDMLESTKKEGKGEDLENAFLNLAQCLQNKPLYFGTCDKALIRILVSCSEVDMLKIRSEFKTSTKRKQLAPYNKALLRLPVDF
ncbi:unnamed protein product [Nyctereutes procyonoides]|uniref:(raccoon dog) hypothetical protein n=1 Tax=Nyctereutes procyonoides TaxID=34880 RepID=A0A811Z2G9_NYCPR|nr:unnamed protein product [Nyctereutes procyonoides]